MPIQLVTENEFEQKVMRSQLPVLVDLFADWCAPCKQMEPILDQLSSELSGKLRIVRVDIEKSPILARSFRVQSIPMLVLFADGRPVDQIVGAVDKNTLLEFVKPVLPTSTDQVEPKELAQLISQRRAIPVDIRDAMSFQRYHIPTATNIPATEIMDRLSEIDINDGRQRILYARTTDDAKDLSEKIRQEGVAVGYLNGGFLHWEADGLEVERGSSS